MIILLVITGLFFWNQMRPSEIKTMCYEELNLKEGETYPVNVSEINNKYRACLERSGLVPEDIIDDTNTLIK